MSEDKSYFWKYVGKLPMTYSIGYSGSNCDGEPIFNYDPKYGFGNVKIGIIGNPDFVTIPYNEIP